MKLLTAALAKKLPKFYATEGIKFDDKVAVVKFFTPDSNWTWYGIEYSPEDRTFFGLVEGFETEFGYFSLSELESVRGPHGMRIERDVNFCPTRMGDIKYRQ